MAAPQTTSVIPLYRKAGDRAQQIGFIAVLRQMLDRLVDEQARLMARPVFPEDRNERRFARLLVLARALTRRGLVAAVVDQIVGDLEREPDVTRVTAVGRPCLVRQP